MINFFQLTQHRESIRNYDSNKPLKQEVIDQILEAGRLAPSAANLQPWKFLLVSSHEMLKKIHETYQRSWFAEAPHILIVTGDRNAAWTRADGYNSIETDLTIAMDYMMLEADSLKVGTCWIANFNEKMLRSVLQLKENEVVFAITPLGYQKEGFVRKGEKIRKPISEVVKYL